MERKYFAWLILCILIASQTYSQQCPPNIGFETGTLDNWQCFAGVINRDGSLNLSPTGPVTDRHTIIQNTYPQQLDPYGAFPVNCPNGSGFSVRLGNSTAGGQAESMSYTFTVPANRNDYSILYNYAVVFQNPAHQPWEQPRFQSKVYNVTDSKYIDCGSFQFVASSNLPGFKLSTFGNNVFYKPWSPVTVNLSGLAGKTIRLEFTTNDCAFTQHFGYAYFDVNEDCSSEPISGNVYCAGAQSVTLTAPYGFATYNWFTTDFSQLLGNQNILNISPAPPSNTTYALVITPYDGVGCQDTLYTTIHASTEPFVLKVLDSITGCPEGVDLTSPLITAGSTPGMTFSYFTDINQIDYVSVPTKISISGIYYIKAVNKSGCNDIKPIKVNLKALPNLSVQNPEGVCKPNTIDLTLPAITTGSELGIKLTYWKNLAGTVPLPNPKAVDTSGTYYIRGDNNTGCNIIKPVDVKVGDVPNIIIHDPTACASVDITAASITVGSTAGVDFSYWEDAATLIPLESPNAIITSGIYFLKVASPSGCSVVRPISATVNPLPTFTVTDPLPAVYPVMTVDITSAVNQSLGLSYTYWIDSSTRKPVVNPRAIDIRGRYFIKATNEFGCSIVKGVNAVIIPPPEPIVYVPTAFTPNNDGLNDAFKIKVIGETAIKHFRIYNRWGQVIFDDADLNHHWNGKLKGTEIPVGVYIWMMDGFDTYFKKPFAQKGLITLIR